ncbi:hypothetical protein [Lacicoccus qingdaonensis]|uniref:NUDIX domain-containing protein n=1 Tax=Lacicoccus qingdaonensis TaxID=576118 RepID=A0A1G9GLF3_9BACL|nr:hypothetical protein [Salinicoccus qingdaonensis]SDL01528.1 hypothetical protein SAMN05216216_1189 [Salinicoccus qingdaonensis]
MIKLIPLSKKVEVICTHKPVQLSETRQDEIENFWADVNKDGKFYRGKVFDIESVTEEKDKYIILLNTTDYAHHLHSVRNHISDAERCRTIFSAALVETTDSKFIIGEMGANTAFPGRLQCAGGGLSNEDLYGDTFDLEKSVLRETKEELAIDEEKHVVRCQPVLMKDVHIHDSLVILYHIKVNMSEEELRKNYQRYVDDLTGNNEVPEFRKIISIDNDRASVHSFFDNDNRTKDDYLEPFLKFMVK